jgi:hypothetical protein
MDFKTQVTLDSKAVEGARFTVRVLNRRQALELEFSIVDARSAMAEIQEQTKNLCGDDISVVDGKEVRTWRINPGSEREYRRLNMQWEMLLRSTVSPAYIRAGLVSFEGYTVNGGKTQTIDELIDRGVDSFLDEITGACVAHSCMSEEDQKNSQSPTTSLPADGQAHNSSIAPAA